MTVEDGNDVQKATPTDQDPHISHLHRAVGGAALVLMLGNLSGSILGFIRQAVIGVAFGLSDRIDAFYAASIVPQMFYDLTVGAAISAALIPTFTETVDLHGEAALWRLVGSVLALVWIVLLVVVGVLFVAARPFMLLVAGGLAPQKSQRVAELAVQPVRILLVTLLFLGTSAVLLSALYSLRRFRTPAFAPSFYHLGIIGGATFFARPLGALALSVGAVVGSAAQAAVQAADLVRLHPRLSIRPSLTPETRKILRLYAPVSAGLVISVAGQIIDLHFKLHLNGGGSLSAMQIATTLTQFPIGIAVAALAFAILPSLSSAVALDREQSFKDTLALGIRFVLFLTIPAGAGYIVLATPIVELLFQHGHHWRHLDTANTALALQGYAIQIPFVGVDQLLIFAFYARKNTLTPMLVGVVGVGIYLMSAMILLPRLQIFGLALANTLQNSLHAIILLSLLLLTTGRFGGRLMFRSIVTSVVATAVMIAVLFVCNAIPSSGGVVLQVIRVLVSMSLGGAAYVAVHMASRSQELNLVRVFLAERLGGRSA
ncbi:MAG: murein biosynthesis integral membrane protein MurJ [Chloroflexota bacterium]